MFDTVETIGECISYHIVGPDKPEVYFTIDDTLPDEVISHIDVLGSCVIDGVLRKKVRGTVVDMQSGWGPCTFT